MPGTLDIYGLTRHRNKQTIDRFLDAYVDREASEERGDEELMLLPRQSSNTIPENYGLEEMDWEPAKTLTHSIQLGLDNPGWCYSIYLRSKIESVDQVILRFTIDEKLVLGLSLEDNEESDASAKDVMIALVTEYDCYLGMVAAVQPPPDSEVDFLSDVGKFIVLHRYYQV